MKAKKILAVVIAFMISLGLVACDFSKLPGMNNVNVEDKNDDEDEDEDEEDETEVTEETEESEETKSSETKNSVNTSISDDWTETQFEFEGVVFQLPFAYKDVEKNGWSFDMADYGYEDGYILNSEEYVFSTIQLENEATYGEDNEITLYIGLINNSDKALDIMECDIYSFDYDVKWQLINEEKVPSLTLPGGLTWGATLDEITAVYGEPDETYVSDSDIVQYTEYTYETGEGQHLILTVYSEEDDSIHGLTRFEYNNK